MSCYFLPVKFDFMIVHVACVSFVLQKDKAAARASQKMRADAISLSSGDEEDDSEDEELVLLSKRKSAHSVDEDEVHLHDVSNVFQIDFLRFYNHILHIFC